MLKCFNACNVSSNSFIFNDFAVCERSLQTMSNYVTSVTINPNSQTNFIYPYIPPVFREFFQLKNLTLTKPITCTCVLAKYFYDFVQRVYLVAACEYNDLSAADWIIANYEKCKNVTDVLPEYDSSECQDYCKIPDCGPTLTYAINSSEGTTG